MIKYVYPEGATPLDADEAQALIPGHITTQEELNQWEQANIQEALKWLNSTNHKPLEITFLINLHKKMFDKTWKWAGRYRRSNKNIGVDYQNVAIDIGHLLLDVDYQIKNKSYGPDEIAYRYHHRLVRIHPFSNGNGRHSRLSCDYLLTYQNLEPFSWGRGDLTGKNEMRRRYIHALRNADKGRYDELCEFVRS